MVTILVDGRELRAEAGGNLAAALLASGFRPFRTTPVNGMPREPFCMMGVCFDCLARIDGTPNRQTCLESVRDGMVVERQLGAADAHCGEGNRP